MTPILILCVLVCQSLGASLSRDMVDSQRYSEKRGGAISGGSPAAPSDPNASMYGGNQGNSFEPAPVGVHGGPTDPNASMYGGTQGNSFEPAPVGVHGGPTDPNASMHGGTQGNSFEPAPLGIHGGPKDPNASIYGKPPGYPSESSHGGPTDPNASHHGRPSSGFVIPGEPNRPPSGSTIVIPNPDGYGSPQPGIVIPTQPPSYIGQPDQSPGGYGPHGAPNNPDASQYGRPEGSPGSVLGPHGAPTDPNASAHGYH